MGFGTIFSTLTFLLIFTGMVAMIITIQQHLAEATIEIKEVKERLHTANNQEVRISGTTYTMNAVTAWKTRYQDEFATGNRTNTTFSGDAIILASTSETGWYDSMVYDTGYPTNYTTIAWSSIEPVQTNIQFHVRSGANSSAVLGSPWVGPDNTSATYYAVPGTPLHVTHHGDRFLQYRAFLNTSTIGTTPTLQDVTIRMRRLVGHTEVRLENTGSGKLAFEETDVYLDGIRILRSTAARVLDEQIAGDPRLWNPGEELNVTVFQDLSSATIVTVTNQHAKAQAVVVP